MQKDADKQVAAENEDSFVDTMAWLACIIIVVATVSSIYGLGDPRQYLKMMLHLSRGERIDQRAILRRLAELQYKRNDMQLQRGTYRVRGELIDIYPAESDEEALRSPRSGPRPPRRSTASKAATSRTCFSWARCRAGLGSI